jgi:hypothetical protein
MSEKLQKNLNGFVVLVRLRKWSGALTERKDDEAKAFIDPA